MQQLFEAFPFIFGILLGISWRMLGGPQAYRIAWALAAIALGSLATLASGEWRESLLFFAFDIALVAVVSAATVVAIFLVQTRRDSSGH